ncbi:MULTISPECIES: 5'-deoxynucleotidase [Thalassotalea]|uniref:5'-deoxynucleotidase n=1 Tax=Thalassotalea castellviae TaxID=3075612 RepID=A0ABU3A4K8_9GAMM|nr:5'-deoxynucleotidase [Thalassotalea sp. W431]MDT0604803.1 5'-deoxynucleotidase [Thalassotalea sp. W431]
MKQSAFLAWTTRMPLIQRWGLMHTFQPENVSEHSHQVAVIAHLLTVIKNKKFKGNLLPEKAATIAIYHEISETKLQDLSSKVKYHNPEFTKEYKKLEMIAEKECLETIPEDIRGEFEALLVQDKVDPEYKDIVKAADLLAALIKTNNELRFHNDEFKNVKENLDNKLAKIKRKLPEVGYFMDIFLASCTSTVDKLSDMDN